MLSSVAPVLMKQLAKAYQRSPRSFQRIAFGASTLAARGMRKAPAPPAPGIGLNWLARQLVDKQNFDHSGIHRPPTQMGRHSTDENAARNVSAMQFVGGLRDHTSLIARPRQFVFRGLAAAIAGADRGRAV